MSKNFLSTSRNNNKMPVFLHPLGIIIIIWFALIFLILSSLLIFTNSEEKEHKVSIKVEGVSWQFLFAVVYGFSILFLVIGGGIVTGHNWARLMFYYATPAYIIVSVLFSMSVVITIISSVVYIFYAYYLSIDTVRDFYTMKKKKKLHL